MKEWMTLTSITAYTRVALDNLDKSLTENSSVHPTDIDYLVTRFRESSMF